jgi:Ni,Fe-hydrogenase I large subunit
LASPADYALGGSHHLAGGGAIIGGELNPAQPLDSGQVTEAIEHSWYDYPPGISNLHPSEGVTEFDVRKEGAYSFVKAPRYSGQPMEVGPLARGLVKLYQGDEQSRRLISSGFMVGLLGVVVAAVMFGFFNL